VETTSPRRTQAERRAQTQAKLLDATIQSLIEVGYAGTTLRAVAARADVSSGAMTHHYPRRVDLVAAAIERLTDQRISAMRAAAAGLQTGTRAGVQALLDLVWTDFSGPLFKVAVKLWIAADDDRELYERLVPLERKLAREIAQAIAELDAQVEIESLDVRVLAVLAAARGLALTEAFEPRQSRRTDQWKLIRPILERVILMTG
jgi:AcrR family transcriptional regulator